MSLADYLELKFKLKYSPELFDEEEYEMFYICLKQYSQSLKIDQSPQSFFEKINKRLPILAKIRKLNNPQLTKFFDSKQRQLTEQAQRLLNQQLFEKTQNDVGSL